MMAELFQTTQQNVSFHIKNIFREGELQQEGTHKKILLVQTEGSREVKRYVDYYNLDIIISVGYRIKSHTATRFRIWATQKLKEFLVKGFVLDDKRLKNLGGGNYFDELLDRIRDIRSSEKVFWRKVLDIYATSIDYNPKTDLSRNFFKMIQNKIHWATHGHTAAEIIYNRADAGKQNMGLTNWPGNKPTKTDIEVAKNYLTVDELDILNRIVTMYLDFAELQALNRVPMYMKDWLSKLNEFLKITQRDILTDSGKISHSEAIDKARSEYEKWQKKELENPSMIEKDFLEAVKTMKKSLVKKK